MGYWYNGCYYQSDLPCHSNDDDNCSTGDLQKKCKKDLPIKDSRCEQTNYFHVDVNDAKVNCKDCKSKKDKKFGCCCDTDSLRELLLFFKRNNTPVYILSETFAYEDPVSTPVFINSIVGNLVYISRGSSSGEVFALMPLCKIDHVLGLGPAPVPGLVNLINEIMAEPTLEKYDCCCIKGVGDTINSVSKIRLLFPFTNAIESENAFLILVVIFIILTVSNFTAVANDDLYILYSPDSSVYFITPVCNIDLLFPLTSSTMLNSFSPYLSKDMKEKLKNIDFEKLFKEISGMPNTEAVKKLNSALS